MRNLFLQIIAGILGLWLAVQFVPGIEIKIIPSSTFLGFPLSTLWRIYIVIGTIFGLINFFIKPILKVITLPLRILTLGLFEIVINMALIWFVSLLFPELIISEIWALFWLTLIIWGLTFLFIFFLSKKYESY